MRAASASNGTGSNSLSARCRASVRRERSSCSSYRSCSVLGRTWCGPADNSARVTALIAISSGSSAGSIQRRSTRMLVSSSPCREGADVSPLIRVAFLVVGGRVLVGTECVQIADRRVAGHCREFLPGDELAPSPDGDQFPDLVAVAGDGERLPPLDGVHDFPIPGAQVPLRDLRHAHVHSVAPGATPGATPW